MPYRSNPTISCAEATRVAGFPAKRTGVIVVAGAALLGLALGACSVAPVPVYLAQPADPNARVPALSYQSVSAGLTSMRPAEPKDWRDLNRRVGPQP